jgi:hypothetical protein
MFQFFVKSKQGFNVITCNYIVNDLHGNKNILCHLEAYNYIIDFFSFISAI